MRRVREIWLLLGSRGSEPFGDQETELTPVLRKVEKLQARSKTIRRRLMNALRFLCVHAAFSEHSVQYQI